MIAAAIHALLSIDAAAAADLVSIAHVPSFTVVDMIPASVANAQAFSPVMPQAPGANVVDWSPTIIAAAHMLFVALGIVAAAWGRSHINDKTDRDNLDALIQEGVGLGMAKVKGAVKGHPLTVDAGSIVAAHAMTWVQEQEPAMIKRLGLDDADVAKKVVAALPAVDGSIDDGSVKGIIAAASGAPLAKAPDMTDIAKMIQEGFAAATRAMIEKRDYGTAAAESFTGPAAPVAAKPQVP